MATAKGRGWITREYSAKDKKTREYIDWIESGKPADRAPAPTGSWKARARHKHYGDVVRRSSVKAKVERWLTETLGKMDDGTYGRVTKDRATRRRQKFCDLVDEYIVTMVAENDQSIGINASYIQHFKAESWAKKPYTLVHADDLKDTVRRMKEGSFGSENCGPLKWTTIRRRLTALRAIFRYGLERDGLDLSMNPGLGVTAPKENKDDLSDRSDRDRIFVDADEEARFFEAAKLYGRGIMYPLTKFAVETAIRKSELVGMRLTTKIDGVEVVTREHNGLEWGMIKFDKALADLPGRITKPGRPRKVPLSPTAISILKGLLESKKKKPAKTDKVFDITNDGVRNAMNRILKAAKMKDFRFHDLRHISMTKWSEDLNIFELMRVTGHTNIQTLSRYYSKEITELAGKMADIERALEEKQASQRSGSAMECTCEKCGHVQGIDVPALMQQVFAAMLTKPA